MKGFCIKLGKFSYFYIYILGCISFNTLKKLSLEYSEILKNKYLFQNIFKYIGFIIFAYLLFVKFKKNLKKTSFIYKKNITHENIEIEKENNNKLNNNKLIFNDNKRRLILKSGGNYIFVVAVIYILYLEILEILDYFGFYPVEFWIFDVIFMLLLMKLFYPESLYKHQIVSMIFVIIICFTLIIKASLCKVYKEGENTIYEYKGILICFSAIIIYIDITFLIFFARMNVKILMDDKFISPYKIMIIIGIIGFIFELILFIVSISINSNKKCQENIYTNIFCYFNTNYFSEFSKKNYYNIIKELFLTICYIISCSLGFICELFIIKYLNPNYILMSDNIYFEIFKVKQYLSFATQDKKLYKENFYILQIAELVEFIGCLIYLELIELNCFGLNKNTKINIIKRSLEEFDNKTIITDNLEKFDNPSECSISESIEYKQSISHKNTSIEISSFIKE